MRLLATLLLCACVGCGSSARDEPFLSVPNALTTQRLTITDQTDTDFAGGTFDNTEVNAGTLRVVPPSPAWWSPTTHYRVSLDLLNNNGLTHVAVPIERLINFAALLPVGETFDTNSVRVVEEVGAAQNEVVSRFDPGVTTDARGFLVFPLTGSTPNGTTRRYYLYFDATEWLPIEAAPSYAINTASTTISNSNSVAGGNYVILDHLSPTLGMLDTATFGGSLQFVSSLGARARTIFAAFNALQFDATRRASFAYDGASTTYTGLDAPRRLASSVSALGNLHVHRTIAGSSAAAANVRVTQYLVMTDEGSGANGPNLRLSYLIENRTAATINNVSFFDGIDCELGASKDNDSALFNTTDRIAYCGDEQDGSEAFAVTAVNTIDHFSAGGTGASTYNPSVTDVNNDNGVAGFDSTAYNVHSVVVGRRNLGSDRGMLRGLLNDNTTFIDNAANGAGQDVAVGVQFDLGSLAAGQSALVQESWVIGDGGTTPTAVYASLQARATDWARLPTQTLGPLEKRYGSYRKVLDSQNAAALWTSAEWLLGINPAGSLFTLEVRVAAAPGDLAALPWTSVPASPTIFATALAGRYLEYRLSFDTNTTGASPEVDLVTFQVTVPPVSVIFTTPPRTAEQGACSEAIGLQLVEETGQGASIATSSTIDLSSGSVTTQFFTDASCTIALPSNQLTIAPIDADVVHLVYARDSSAGVHALNAQSPSLPDAAQALTVVAVPVDPPVDPPVEPPVDPPVEPVTPAPTPAFADSDADGVGDDADNCVSVTNADQLDRDADGVGDACDRDANNDGFYDDIGASGGGCNSSGPPSPISVLLLAWLALTRRQHLARAHTLSGAASSETVRDGFVACRVHFSSGSSKRSERRRGRKNIRARGSQEHIGTEVEGRQRS